MVERIFVSSLARGEMGAVRAAARRAIESLEMVPVMFETEGASHESSRRTLLDRIATCDALLLLLGGEYGTPGARGISPTHEEFDEARVRGVPVLAVVQDIEREPEQEQFLRLVRGGWEEGRLSASFTGTADVGFAVTRTLDSWRRRRSGGDTVPAAQARALELARGDEQGGLRFGGSKLRVVAVPALDRPLIDALALRDASLVDDLSGAARASELVPHIAGIEPEIGSSEIILRLSGGSGFEQLTLRVGFDGGVVGEGAVGGDSVGFAEMVVLADRARMVMDRTVAFAEAVWRRIDARDEVRDVALACAVPEADHKVYALEDVTGSMSMPMSMPHVLVAPESPLRARRADLLGAVERLQAELHRAFELEGAVHPPGR